ncbi:DUF1285 domain-containing protein [Shewanella sp. 202IG2-18]|uniref:DUF1285 domain-containing protein n=1 Tax=Parashewanella hymeniacidonis TaxID=2807618 RepID=UPI00196183AF|nr:DUF1285 domain-containing protein [Parashewanella hymeniacidonis]MBM7072499.1 DUF1285 domain-containing protein [Parashewanella hymeniacidonis]
MSEPTSESILKDFSLRQDVCDNKPLFDIDVDGNWFYQGSPLPKKFAKLFYSILFYQDKQHYLITPVEKVKVYVVQEPIKIVDYQLLESGQVEITTSLDTQCMLESLNAITVLDDKITCLIQHGLTASFNRPTYYRYIDEVILT